jgi:hypothetical protein
MPRKSSRQLIPSMCLPRRPCTLHLRSLFCRFRHRMPYTGLHPEADTACRTRASKNDTVQQLVCLWKMTQSSSWYACGNDTVQQLVCLCNTPQKHLHRGLVSIHTGGLVSI